MQVITSWPLPEMEPDTELIGDLLGLSAEPSSTPSQVHKLPTIIVWSETAPVASSCLLRLLSEGVSVLPVPAITRDLPSSNSSQRCAASPWLVQTLSTTQGHSLPQPDQACSLTEHSDNRMYCVGLGGGWAQRQSLPANRWAQYCLTSQLQLETGTCS